MTAISTPNPGRASDSEGDNEARRSEANSCIMARRCSNGAGLGALSAFWVARRRSNRLGDGEGLESVRRADVAIRKWAIVGGLNEESSI